MDGSNYLDSKIVCTLHICALLHENQTSAPKLQDSNRNRNAVCWVGLSGISKRAPSRHGLLSGLGGLALIQRQL